MPVRLQIIAKSAAQAEKYGSTLGRGEFAIDRFLAQAIVQSGNAEDAVAPEMKAAITAEVRVKVVTHYIDGSKELQSTVVLKDRFRPSGLSHWFEFKDDNTDKRVMSGTLQAVLPATAISS